MFHCICLCVCVCILILNVILLCLLWWHLGRGSHSRVVATVPAHLFAGENWCEEWLCKPLQGWKCALSSRMPAECFDGRLSANTVWSFQSSKIIMGLAEVVWAWEWKHLASQWFQKAFPPQSPHWLTEIYVYLSQLFIFEWKAFDVHLKIVDRDFFLGGSKQNTLWALCYPLEHCFLFSSAAICNVFCCLTALCKEQCIWLSYPTTTCVSCPLTAPIKKRKMYNSDSLR